MLNLFVVSVSDDCNLSVYRRHGMASQIRVQMNVFESKEIKIVFIEGIVLIRISVTLIIFADGGYRGGNFESYVGFQETL